VRGENPVNLGREAIPDLMDPLAYLELKETQVCLVVVCLEREAILETLEEMVFLDYQAKKVPREETVCQASPDSRETGVFQDLLDLQDVMDWMVFLE